MKNKHRITIVISLFALILAIMACALPGTASQGTKPTATPTSQKLVPLTLSTNTTTPTPGVLVSGSSISVGSSTGGTGGNSGGAGSSAGGTGGGNSGSNGGSNESTPPPLPDIQTRPYIVKQIETLGGEVISGVVCSLAQPFSVLSTTPHVTFSFAFVPLNAQQGKVSYAYSIKSAGESHDASGTYSLTPVGNDGTLQLSMAVSDHVVFKGFDGNIPNHYKFNLVPSDNSTCP